MLLAPGGEREGGREEAREGSNGEYRCNFSTSSFDHEHRDYTLPPSFPPSLPPYHSPQCSSCPLRGSQCLGRVCRRLAWRGGREGGRGRATGKKLVRTIKETRRSDMKKEWKINEK
jgi:hypothetical protein